VDRTRFIIGIVNLVSALSAKLERTVVPGLAPELVDELGQLGVGQVEAGERDSVDDLEIRVLESILCMFQLRS
jgi:hypothetical protein